MFGLKDLLAPTNCSGASVLVLNTSHDWPVYVSPGILLLLCYAVVSLLKLPEAQALDQVGARGRPTVLAPPGAPNPSVPETSDGKLSSGLWAPASTEGGRRGQ